jgi:hypothetical protein
MSYNSKKKTAAAVASCLNRGNVTGKNLQKTKNKKVSILAKK